MYVHSNQKLTVRNVNAIIETYKENAKDGNSSCLLTHGIVNFTDFTFLCRDLKYCVYPPCDFRVTVKHRLPLHRVDQEVSDHPPI